MKILRSDQAQKLMGHDVGSYTLQRVYDQSVGAIDLTRVGLGGDKRGEDVPRLDLTLSPYLMIGGGRKYKPPTVRGLVGQDPQLVAISGDIDAIERCLATNSTDWLSLPSFQEQQSLSHPDSCPHMLRLLKFSLRRRLAYWKDASQREFALTRKESNHLQVVKGGLVSSGNFERNAIKYWKIHNWDSEIFKWTQPLMVVTWALVKY